MTKTILTTLTAAVLLTSCSKEEALQPVTPPVVIPTTNCGTITESSYYWSQEDGNVCYYTLETYSGELYSGTTGLFQHEGTMGCVTDSAGVLTFTPGLQ